MGVPQDVQVAEVNIDKDPSCMSADKEPIDGPW
jgi:hypothetical protein